MEVTEQIKARLQELLPDVDLATTTERQIREQLAKELSIDDMAPYKPLVREQIQAYLEATTVADDEDDEDEEPSNKKRRRSPPMGGTGPELSPELAAVVGYTHMQRPQVVKAIWAYIKDHNLQDPNNKRNIILDSKLATIFEPPVDIFSMNKQITKHIGTGEPSTRQRKTSSSAGGKKNSGFNKPIVLSDDMAAWYGKAYASRGEVVKFFHNYIKEHNLKDPTNKQYVVCDDALLKLTGQKRFKAFGVNKFINKHFLVDEEVVLDEEDEEQEEGDVKAEPAAVAAAVAAKEEREEGDVKAEPAAVATEQPTEQVANEPAAEAQV